MIRIIDRKTCRPLGNIAVEVISDGLDEVVGCHMARNFGLNAGNFRVLFHQKFPEFKFGLVRAYYYYAVFCRQKAVDFFKIGPCNRYFISIRTCNFTGSIGSWVCSGKENGDDKGLATVHTDHNRLVPVYPNPGVCELIFHDNKIPALFRELS